MFGSKNNTFYKTRTELDSIYHDMDVLLRIKGRSEDDVWKYKKAFTYFRTFPHKFDGATIVKDLNDLPNLDLDAMLHDYECLIGANRNFIKWFKSAWKYFENMRKNGKGNQIFRFVLVCLAGFVFVPYCAIFTPKYYPIKK